MMKLNKSQIKRRLIIVITILGLGWFWHYGVKYRPWDIHIPVVASKYTQPDFEFSTVKIREVSGQREYYRMRSSRLTIDKNKAQMSRVSGNILSNGTSSLLFDADVVDLDLRRSLMIMTPFRGMTINEKRHKLDRRWWVSGKRAIYSQNLQTVVIDGSPALKSGDLELTAKSFTYLIPQAVFQFNDDCSLKNKDYQITSKLAALKTDQSVLSLEQQVSFKTDDFTCNADLLDYAYEDKKYIFKNNVKFEHTNSVLSATEVVMDKDKNIVRFNGAVQLITADTVINSNRAVLYRDKRKVEFFEGTKGYKGSSALQSDFVVFDLEKNQFVSNSRTRITKGK